MRESKMAKTKGVKYWKSRAWNEFSKYVRLRDAIGTTGTKDWLICCSCGRKYPAFGKGCAQAGHFIPGRSHALLFREKGVHGQCYNCNQTLKGNWVEYEKFMRKKYGLMITEEEKAAKYLNVKYSVIGLERFSKNTNRNMRN
ncbi:hypothetical protein LCGC14_3091650 [marine sediment metagenome]|uniref:Uncharacterized protein n=1 Tax=marine sediment metagenome TaxID=412755 RepID=A0A0F8Z0P6_9ZZZZ